MPYPMIVETYHDGQVMRIDVPKEHVARQYAGRNEIARAVLSNFQPGRARARLEELLEDTLALRSTQRITAQDLRYRNLIAAALGCLTPRDWVRAENHVTSLMLRFRQVFLSLTTADTTHDLSFTGRYEFTLEEMRNAQQDYDRAQVGIWEAAERARNLVALNPSFTMTFDTSDPVGFHTAGKEQTVETPPAPEVEVVLPHRLDNWRKRRNAKKP